jgi:hypothetical protein
MLRSQISDPWKGFVAFVARLEVWNHYLHGGQFRAGAQTLS